MCSVSAAPMREPCTTASPGCLDQSRATPGQKPGVTSTPLPLEPAGKSSRIRPKRIRASFPGRPGQMSEMAVPMLSGGSALGLTLPSGQRDQRGGCCPALYVGTAKICADPSPRPRMLPCREARAGRTATGCSMTCAPSRSRACRLWPEQSRSAKSPWLQSYNPPRSFKAPTIRLL